MLAKIAQIMQIIEGLAPKRLAEDWDNTGLQVGDPAAEVRTVMVALDLTGEVLEEALKKGANLVVCHHPVIFKGLKNLRMDLPLGQRLARAVQGGVAVYAAHTNLDAAGGVNDALAAELGLTGTEPLGDGYTDKLYKIVVFIPLGHQDQVRQALAEAGAGFIGNYSHCSFEIPGTGTFLPLDGANPFIGKPGNLERVEEVRVETIVPESRLWRAVRAMIRAHPYEEPAYDIYPLANQGQSFGLGRVGRLDPPLSLADLARLVRDRLRPAALRICGDPGREIKKVAVCGGSGAALIGRAAAVGADCLVTGDIKHHEALEAQDTGLALIDAGHYATEAVILPVLADRLRSEISALKLKTSVLVTEVGSDPMLQFERG